MKKADDSVFLLEMLEVEIFAKSEVVVKLVYPECMKTDIFEMHFNANLMEILADDNRQDMVGKLKQINLTTIEEMKPGATAAEWQADMINSVVLKLFSEGAADDDAVLKMIAMLKCFVSPLPLLP